MVEVVNGDALVIKKGDQQYQKIWFSSIRPPRLVLRYKFSCREAKCKCLELKVKLIRSSLFVDICSVG